MVQKSLSRRVLAPVSCLLAIAVQAVGEPPRKVAFEATWSDEWALDEGAVVAIQVGLEDPSGLPPNARLEVRWLPPEGAAPEAFPGERGDLATPVSSGLRKTLHSLDPDLYLLYRAPVAGAYRLVVEALDEGVSSIGVFGRDSGLAPLATGPPTRLPSVGDVGLLVDVQPVPRTASEDLLLEVEPNNAPEQALPIPFAAIDAEQTIHLIGSADELEYFNNAQSGSSPDDWYRIENRGSERKLLTANLQMVEPVVSARIRVYQPGEPSPEDLAPREPPKRELFGNANPVPYVHPPAEVVPGPIPVFSYWEGRDINERIHQQDDNFRSFVTRLLEPGGVYFLRVEANQPGYELELRLVDPAPYDDPRRAVRESIHYQLAEVDAWLIHRPRNIAVHRRVRDGSSLFGENCMSCHTQSGVWGVADAFRHGYRPGDAVQNHRRLVNTMYESLRPSVKLDDAAVNTSLAPNDFGDAPAGSRVAGRNIVLHERTFEPKKLQSHQQRRTANYVLLTADPQGINAAGKGSNFGPNVVFKFAAEILERAWRDTGDPKYFWGLEEKARRILATGDDGLKVVDDLGHRIEFFHDLFPAKPEYLATVARLSDADPRRIEEASAFYESLRGQVEKDLQRLLSLQQDSGGWGFDLGVRDGEHWSRIDEEPDAAPTAVSLIALRAAGYGPQDPVVERAVGWLLENQFEYGLWNRAAQTGFVTNAYVIRALSRLYPGEDVPFQRAQFEPREGESLPETISRVRRLQTTGRADFADLMIEAAGSEQPQVRYYGYLGLGGALAEAGLAQLIAGLDDPVKACREAAFWSLRQLLLDDVGWEAAFKAYRSGNARTRQSIVQALVSRADLEGPEASMTPNEAARLLAEAMSDSHPGVRAYAFKAAWRWWVWNPAMREILNKAWAAHLLEPELDANAEAALRYSTASMLIVNGQIANQTGGRQYRPAVPGACQALRPDRGEAGRSKSRGAGAAGTATNGGGGDALPGARE